MKTNNSRLHLAYYALLEAVRELKTIVFEFLSKIQYALCVIMQHSVTWEGTIGIAIHAIPSYSRLKRTPLRSRTAMLRVSVSEHGLYDVKALITTQIKT